MENLPNEFDRLYHEAERRVSQERAAQQIVVVQTAQSNQYAFANRGVLSGSTAAEDRFAEMLAEKEDTLIRLLVCMWHTYELDVPSRNLVRRLTELDPGSLEARVLLKGTQGIVVKTLKELLPPAQ